MLQDAPSLGHQREAAFALVTQGAQQRIGRHSHAKAKPEQPGTPPPPTGIDYLALLRAEHEQAERRRIRYDALAVGEDGQDQDTAEGGR
jgi:hypothetical protein